MEACYNQHKTSFVVRFKDYDFWPAAPPVQEELR